MRDLNELFIVARGDGEAGVEMVGNAGAFAFGGFGIATRSEKCGMGDRVAEKFISLAKRGGSVVGEIGASVIVFQSFLLSFAAQGLDSIAAFSAERQTGSRPAGGEFRNRHIQGRQLRRRSAEQR